MDNMELRFKAIKKQFAKHKAEYLKESKPKTKPTIKYRKSPYWCKRCNRFHKYLFQGKPSKTHKAHFKDIYKFKSEYSQSELFKLDFKKKWNKESNNPKCNKES